MKGFPDLPPVWLVAFLILNWGVSKLLPGFPVGVFTANLGLSLIVIGLALIGWSAFWFWRRKTTIEPHHAPKTLIVEGPYRLSRNPIYLAMVIILLGSVFGRGQPLSLILIPTFVVILTVRFILPEEAALRKAFGDAADAYLKATRRWL